MPGNRENIDSIIFVLFDVASSQAVIAAVNASVAYIHSLHN